LKDTLDEFLPGYAEKRMQRTLDARLKKMKANAGSGPLRTSTGRKQRRLNSIKKKKANVNGSGMGRKSDGRLKSIAEDQPLLIEECENLP
jgi:hypothetical protein